MALKTLVKVGEISNLSDARYCAGMGVEMLGFNINADEKSYNSPESFTDIINWVAGVKFVGEFLNVKVEDIKLATLNYKFDFIEINDVSSLSEVSEIGIPIIFNLEITDSKTLGELPNKMEIISDYCSHVILSSNENSLYDQIDEKLSETNHSLTVFKGFDINENRTPKILSNKSYAGIAVKGSEEEKPGFKDYGELMDLLETLEED
ncbi:MAG: hypothetical protein JXR03_12915 [Cyclobacteriaceae bacterium]